MNNENKRAIKYFIYSMKIYKIFNCPFLINIKNNMLYLNE